MLGFKPTPGVKHKDVYLRVFDATKKSMYTDQSGPFPIKSRRKHQYIMIAVELDGNYIDAEPLKTRKAKDLTEAYQQIYKRWKATGVVSPNWHVLDNEAPEEFKQAIRENNCRVELTPADMHRRNVAEKAMQTFKGHFKSVLAGVSDSSYLESSPSIACSTEHFGICIPPRQLRLQSNAVSADGMRCSVSC